ncbi:MAG: branched-chain amino acid ABC transporter permease [Ectothiorhodospiraceae bacterium]|nr:branched-chain amino acid ABC transporter permease [Ectothiorhodospiraceae bacterium]
MGRLANLIGLVALLAVPMLGVSDYVLHLGITILIWGFVYTAWSLMGRFGLVSLGHGAFLGIGAYTVTMLWNHAGISPWLGIPVAVALAVLVAVLIGYPCFRFRITGHYFALVTLALGEIVLMLIVALRDWTGGSLGVTPASALSADVSFSLVALQVSSKGVFFYVAVGLWLLGLWVWKRVDSSMARYALEAANEQEDAAASVGVDVTRTKLTITVLSAALTALGGIAYGQYQLYINPETVSGIAKSLEIVFAVIAGGMYVRLGPTFGAAFTLLLAEGLRVAFGHDVHGLDGTIYGLMLVIFIIFMPEGILGRLARLWETRRAPTSPRTASA